MALNEDLTSRTSFLSITYILLVLAEELDTERTEGSEGKEEEDREAGTRSPTSEPHLAQRAPGSRRFLEERIEDGEPTSKGERATKHKQRTSSARLTSRRSPLHERWEGTGG